MVGGGRGRERVDEEGGLYRVRCCGLIIDIRGGEGVVGDVRGESLLYFFSEWGAEELDLERGVDGGGFTVYGYPLG